MLVHGENDNDVPIAEAEQYYIALRDVGTDAMMVRYPREGHGVREPAPGRLDRPLHQVVREVFPLNWKYMIRHAEAQWNGSLKEGSGHVKSRNRSPRQPVQFPIPL